MTSPAPVSTKARHLRHLLLVAIGQAEIGRRIKQAREDAGFTQPQLADKIGLRHPQSISRYERGETEVSSKRLRRIAEATNKPLSYFVMAEAGEDGDGGEGEATALSPNAVTELLKAVEANRQLLESVLERIDALEGELRAKEAPPEAAPKPA